MSDAPVDALRRRFKRKSGGDASQGVRAWKSEMHLTIHEFATSRR
jgi:hypothetical protein